MKVTLKIGDTGLISQADGDLPVKDEIIGRNLQEFIPKGDASSYATLMGEVKEGFASFDLRFDFKFPSMEQRMMHVSGIKDRTGSRVLFLTDHRKDLVEMLVNHYEKDKSTVPDDSFFYEDMTRITNEMMSMQRRLENTNRELALEKERIRVTMNSIGEGVISTDMDGTVQFINEQGKVLLSVDDSILNRPIQEAIPGMLMEEGGLYGRIKDAVSNPDEPIRLIDVPLLCGEPPCPVLDITLSAIRSPSGKLAGGVVVFFKDVSEKKRAQEALHNANRKLNLLSSITRHDTLNTVTALMGYLELAQDLNNDAKIGTYMEKIYSMTERISSQISATRDYQEVGVKEAVWVNVRDAIQGARAELDLGALTLELDIPYVLEIFADPMVTKVFYNLMENTLRHGKGTTLLQFGMEKDGRHLLLVYQDDGGGVEPEYKEKIFRREHFSNTGFGLFLSREILGITEMEISENGVFGKGARFEIKILPDHYRIT